MFVSARSERIEGQMPDSRDKDQKPRKPEMSAEQMKKFIGTERDFAVVKEGEKKAPKE
jgi:hypothetical protein